MQCSVVSYIVQKSTHDDDDDGYGNDDDDGYHRDDVYLQLMWK